MKVTAFDLAQRFVGVKEIPGEKSHPLIEWGFMLCGWGVETSDEVPWCSAWAQVPAWMLRLPRSKSARARSWLMVGREVPLEEAKPGFDVVILTRGGGEQPGPEVIEAPGHVGYFAGWSSFTDRGGTLRPTVLVLGGNQSNAVSVHPYDQGRILGIRRLWEA